MRALLWLLAAVLLAACCGFAFGFESGRATCLAAGGLAVLCLARAFAAAERFGHDPWE